MLTPGETVGTVGGNSALFLQIFYKAKIISKFKKTKPLMDKLNSYKIEKKYIGRWTWRNYPEKQRDGKYESEETHKWK